MSTDETGSHDTQAISERFVTTHWSQVLLAADHQSPDSAKALEKLCRAYWPPLYCYLRRDGRSSHEAEDPPRRSLRGSWSETVSPRPILNGDAFATSC
jgi:hypothetical protein